VEPDLIFRWLTTQGPIVVVLTIVAWRLERQLSEYSEFIQDILTTLLEQRDKKHRD